jgi:hypothetical protein
MAYDSKPSIREKPAGFLSTGHQCKYGLLPSIKTVKIEIKLFENGGKKNRQRMIMDA